MSARRPLGSAVALAAAMLVGVFFSAGAQAARGPRPDVLRRRQADDRLRLWVSAAAATVRQPDGKILAVGSFSGRTTTSRSLVTIRTARSIRPSPATESHYRPWALSMTG